MKLSIVYIILAFSFGISSVVSVPRDGCYGAVCSDFQSVGVITFLLFGLALLFSILGLLRLLKQVKLNQLHKYDSKDLNNLDGQVVPNKYPNQRTQNSRLVLLRR